MISFHSENIKFSLPQKAVFKKWFLDTIKSEEKIAKDISFVFCDDDYLHQMNTQYLDHDTLTDIITFDYGDKKAKTVSGDIFISVPRIKDNASKFGVQIQEELSRVMIHGILHLCGYKDKNASDKKTMTQKENFYLTHLNLLK